MKPQEEMVKDFEARAKALGVPMNDILREAGLSKQTWWNLRKGTFHARLVTLNKLDAALKKAEATPKAVATK